MINYSNYSCRMGQANGCLQKAQSYMDKMELDPACFGPAKKEELKKAYKHFKKAEHFARLIRASLKPDSYEARSNWENLIHVAEFSAFDLKNQVEDWRF